MRGEGGDRGGGEAISPLFVCVCHDFATLFSLCGGHIHIFVSIGIICVLEFIYKTRLNPFGTSKEEKENSKIQNKCSLQHRPQRAARGCGGRVGRLSELQSKVSCDTRTGSMAILVLTTTDAARDSQMVDKLSPSFFFYTFCTWDPEGVRVVDLYPVYIKDCMRGDRDSALLYKIFLIEVAVFPKIFFQSILW